MPPTVLPRPDLPPGVLRARRAVVALAALAAVGVVSACAWAAHAPLGDLPYAAGLRGTPGSYVASSCVRLHNGAHGLQQCVGDFVPRAGGPADHGIQQLAAVVDIGVGRPESFMRTPDERYVQVGDSFVTSDVLGALTLLLLAVVAVTGLSAVRIGMLTTLSRAVQLRLALFTAALTTAIGLVAAVLYVVLSAGG